MSALSFTLSAITDFNCDPHPEGWRKFLYILGQNGRDRYGKIRNRKEQVRLIQKKLELSKDDAVELAREFNHKIGVASLISPAVAHFIAGNEGATLNQIREGLVRDYFFDKGDFLTFYGQGRRGCRVRNATANLKRIGVIEKINKRYYVAHSEVCEMAQAEAEAMEVKPKAVDPEVAETEEWLKTAPIPTIAAKANQIKEEADRVEVVNRLFYETSRLNALKAERAEIIDNHKVVC